MDDPRIGTIDADGVRIWPLCTIEGQPYERPINEAPLGDNRFVVFGVNGISDEHRAAALLGVEVLGLPKNWREQVPAKAQVEPSPIDAWRASLPRPNTSFESVEPDSLGDWRVDRVDSDDDK